MDATRGHRARRRAREVQVLRLQRTLVVVLSLVVVASVLRGWMDDPGQAVSGSSAAPASRMSPSQVSTPPQVLTPPRSAAASPRASAASPRASGSPSPSNLPAGHSVDPRGFVRSNLASTGSYRASTITANDEFSRARTWILQVESSVPADVNQTARQVQAILDDPKGWRGVRSGPAAGARFRLVDDPKQARLVVRLASPASVDKRCPLDTKGLWSCATGHEVLVNADRWFYSTPTFVDFSLDQYRAYLINHEIGHILGLGHVGCPGAGKPAPVMMQQSKGLDGCRANPWPAP